MRTQTIYKTGNSSVMTIPSDLGEEYGYVPGVQVQVVPSGQGDDLILRKAAEPRTHKTSGKVSSEFKKWLKGALQEDDEILNELA